MTRDQLDTALQHHQAGRLAEAEQLYRRILATNPDHADALHLLGVVANQAGAHLAAIDLIGRAIAARGDAPHYHVHLAMALKGLGRLDEAVASYQRVLALAPGDAATHNNLGLALQAQGCFAEALASYDRAIALSPAYARCHSNRADMLLQQGKLPEAITSYDRALLLDPSPVNAMIRHGNALGQQGRWRDALSSYDRAIALRPALADAHYNRGLALVNLGEHVAALTSYDQALALRPDDVNAHYNRANALLILGRCDAALAGYDRALSLSPDLAPAHHRRGTALNNLGRFDDAIASYRRAAASDPRSAEVHADLGVTLRYLGLVDDATTAFERAAAIAPRSFEYACLQKLALPVILDSAPAVTRLHKHYRRSIDELMAHPGTLDNPDNTNTVFSFYLAYHDCDDRETLQVLCRLYRVKAPSLTYQSPHIRQWRPPEGRRRIRIGFLSSYFCNHTIEKLNRGFIRHLDRRRFDVVLLRTPDTPRDADAARLDKLANRSVVLPRTLAEQREAIAGERLDILFYPDIGMSRESYLLAFARLAPVQALSWGHPITSGLDTLDYFLSARGTEPPDGDLHYSERLVRLSRLPCVYERPGAPAAIPGRQELGLPASGTLYGCPQSLYKFHPDFDAVLAEIADGDPEGHIVLLQGLDPAWGDLLRRRWSERHPALVRRVLFLPRVSTDRFMALVATFDVLLDPVHFGSGNTLYEAMVFGTPIVTWPGRFMRGRIVAAAYRQMGVADAPIAATLEGYAPLALALGRDPERREALRQASLAAANALFADRRAADDFEAFAEAALVAAAGGDKLAAGWQPTPQSPTG